MASPELFAIRARGIKASVSIVDEDRGMAALIKAFKDEGEPYALAGIRQEAGVYEDPDDGEPLNIAEIAIVNEFGSLDGRIPSRPWIRSAWDRNVGRYTKRMQVEAGKVIDGKQTFLQALDRVILGVESDQVDSLVALRDPPNAPRTLAAKAPKTNPLVDTGQLAQSHDSAVFHSDGTIATPWKKGG